MTGATQETSPLLERVRRFGKCPPSLLKWVLPNSFDEKVLGVLEDNGLSLRPDRQAGQDFFDLLKICSSLDNIPGSIDRSKKLVILVQRRAILLTVMGTTARNNFALKQILALGGLMIIKTWLEDILSNNIGSVDLLLHLLSSITYFPVTKEMVANSNLGKDVVAIATHKIYTGANENAIKERIATFKVEWSKSCRQHLKEVKEESSLKDKSTNATHSKNGHGESSSMKRPLDTPSTSYDTIKKVKMDTNSHMNTSSLLSNVQNRSESNNKSKSDSEGTKRITWADDKLFVYDDMKSGRKSDHMDKSRKSKVSDRQAKLDAMGKTNPPLVPWRKPQPLKNINAVQVTSNELAKQVSRMASVVPAEYATDEDVPKSPMPLNDIEQALDMTSQASSNPETIPFFAPQQEKEVVAPPAPAIPVPQQQPLPPANIPPPVPQPLVPPPPPPRAVPTPVIQGATVELVQALGLPLFLVGQNIQALQTLAATPNLLNTFVDASGMFDQVRLLTLVQTLTQNLTPTQPVAPAPAVPVTQNPYGNQFQQNPLMKVGMNSGYQPPVSQTTSTYQQNTSNGYQSQTSLYGNNNQNQQNKFTGASAGYRGDQNGSDANLHISGYGPTTTQADIMTLFAPYVHVVEVVTKNGFSFVNTRDPAGAKRAREALNGAILGGRPIRINIATRRAPNPAHINNYGRKPFQQHNPVAQPLPRNALGQVDYDQVRDDRGNPATKNLFVAGYGPGTNDQELRAIFAQHAQVSGVVMKGSFAFINTTDKVTAVQAREALIGTPLNGGVLRINFAKESGRLGTSFDQSYGPASRVHYNR